MQAIFNVYATNEGPGLYQYELLYKQQVREHAIEKHFGTIVCN